MGFAGELRERITVRQKTIVVDPIGGQSEGPPTTFVADLPAAVDPLTKSMERVQVGQLRGAISKLVRIRYREDITDDMDVLWRNRVLEIGLVDLLPQIQQTHLYCAEVQ